MAFEYLKSTIHSAAVSAAAALAPVLSESQFTETGKITPGEFLEAGHRLTFLSPSWVWEAGSESKRLSYLPPTQQMLASHNLPCEQRARAPKFEESLVDCEALDGEDEWLSAGLQGVDHTGANVVDMDDMDDMDAPDAPEAAAAAAAAASAAAEPDADDALPDMDDMDDFEDLGAEVDDAALHSASDAAAAAAAAGGEGAACDDSDPVRRVRTYNLYITYDNYYRTPRLWLNGFDGFGRPLSSDQVFEDISSDHANKTVRIEAHPHLDDMLCVSIHPCRHAEVMKRMIDMSARSGKPLEVRDSLVVFLKFMSAVIPTIRYDFTRGVDT